MEACPERIIGRYALYGEIASGGMATVHYGRLLGPVGFARMVAIKRLHPHLAKDPEFVTMFLDEARLVARIRHPNVVPTLDVVAAEGELLLVMEYVQGDSLLHLLRRVAGVGMPPAVASAVMSNVLFGLHAAHEATNEHGRNLTIVHRDVTPSNVLVGIDGVSRVVDFGVAKAMGRLQQTADGAVKGKFGYMSPEQVMGQMLDSRSDVFGASVVLWEALCGRRLFKRDNAGAMVSAVLQEPVVPPSRHARVSAAVDAIVLKGLQRMREDRFPTARHMAVALEEALAPATPRQVADWVAEVAKETLEQRAEEIAAIERESVSTPGVRGAAPPGSGDDAPSHSPQAAIALQHTPATGSAIVHSPIAPAPASGGARWRAALVGAATASLVAGAGIAAVIWSRPSPTSAQPEPDAVAVAASPSAPAAPASAAPDARSAEPIASAPAAATHHVRVRPEPASRQPVPPHKQTPPKPGAKVDCTNPFTIDSEGKKRPRPECFR